MVTAPERFPDFNHPSEKGIHDMLKHSNSKLSAGRSNREQARPSNVGDVERILSVGAGTLLALTGFSTLGRSPLKSLLGMGLGAALLYRGASGWCGLYAALGIDHDRDREGSQAALSSGEGIRVEKSIKIAQPPEEAFRFWRDLNRLPQVMSHLESVQVIDSKRSHWIAKGPLGTSFEWDAEIIEEKDGEMISWKSVGESPIATAGSVHFKPVDDEQGTEVRVLLRYAPPGGGLGDTVARLLGDAPEQQIEQDLKKYAASVGGAASGQA